MHYPSIEEYKVAVGIPESFATLDYLKPVLDGQGFPVFIAGGPAVVFKMQDSRNSEKLYALKCFTQEQAQRKYHFEEIHKYLKKLNSPYLVDYEYLENELWVNDGEYPVLLMEWIEGETMSQKIGELCEVNDKQGLATLAYNFNKMAIWLLQQDFAHGDIKPENIQVTLSGDLKLLDYDGMFVPTLAGEPAPELGTAEYRHPMRTEADFNAHLDDFSILVLSLSLLSLQKKPELYDPEHQGDGLLFTADDYKALYRSRYYHFFTQEAANDQNISSLFGLLQYAVSIPVLQLIGLQNLLERNDMKIDKLNIAVKTIKEFSIDDLELEFGEEFDIIDTKVNPDEPTWVDEYGVTYSADKTRLIKGNEFMVQKENDLVYYEYKKKYKVLEGCKIICDDAFRSFGELVEIDIPEGVECIGSNAFTRCDILKKVYLPSTIKQVGSNPFALCKRLRTIDLATNHSYFEFEDGILYTKGKSKILACCQDDWIRIIREIPDSVKEIGDGAFAGCRVLINMGNGRIKIPKTVLRIGELAFYGCNMSSFILSEGLESIGKNAFWGCDGIREIYIPKTLKNMGDNPFNLCKNLKKVLIDPEHPYLKFEDNILHTKDGRRIIMYLPIHQRKSIQLPNTVKEIGGLAFSNCKDLTEIGLSKNIQYIGPQAFFYCENIEKILLPDNLQNIESDTFTGCSSLTKVPLPTGLKEIKSNAFSNCRQLKDINLQEGLESIGNRAFDSCENLTNIKIPKSLKAIGDLAFSRCESFTQIYLPKNINKYGHNPFAGCTNLNEVFVESDNPYIEMREGVLYTEEKKKLLTYLCTNLREDFIVPSFVKEIGNDAFFRCDSLKTLTLPNGIKSIGGWAFFGCHSLTTINLPETVAHIGDWAFKSCSNLSHIYVPKDNIPYDKFDREYWTKFIEI